MDYRSNFVLVLVLAAVITGVAVGAITAPVAAQASANGSNDTEFDDPSSNTTFDDPSTNATFNSPSDVGGNTSINDSSSYLNTNVTYKPPGNITDGGLINNSTSGVGVNPPKESGGKAKTCGSLLDAILGDEEIIGILGCILKGTIISIFFEGFMNLIQDIFNTVVIAIFSTPVPKVNGDPAFFAKPTNAPWGILWEIAMFRMVPAGLLIWATLFLGSYGVISILPLGAFAEQKRRQLQNRAVLAIVGVLGAWGMGAIFLWMTYGFTMAIVPKGGQIASNGVLLIANVRSALITIFAIYLSSGVLAAYFMILIIIRYLIALIFMIALPVAIPFIMIDAGPFRYMSNIVERFIDTCIIFIMMVIPMGLVLRGGYAVVNAINKSQAGPGGNDATSAILSIANESGMLIFITWVLAALTPIFLFREMGQVKGIASSAIQMGQEAHDRYQELTESDGEDIGQAGPDGPNNRARDYEPWMENNAKPTEFGGALEDGWVRGEDGQTEPAGMLGRGPGMLANPSDPHASPNPNRLDAGHPAASALPSGNENSQATGGGGRWSQFGDWMGNARNNLGDRINNAQEMRDTVQENGGNIAAGVAGATVGFFGAGAGSQDDDKTEQNTTTSNTDTERTAQDTTTSKAGGESTSRSTTGTSERTTRSTQSGTENQSQSSGDVARYREEEGRNIFIPQSTAGLPSHMDIGPITSDGFQKTSEGTETDTVVGEFSRMEDKYREQGNVFVARDPGSGQLYDLSEVESNQEPPERDHNAEERAKRSARDVENAREEAND